MFVPAWTWVMSFSTEHPVMGAPWLAFWGGSFVSYELGASEFGSSLLSSTVEFLSIEQPVEQSNENNKTIIVEHAIFFSMTLTF